MAKQLLNIHVTESKIHVAEYRDFLAHVIDAIAYEKHTTTSKLKISGHTVVVKSMSDENIRRKIDLYKYVKQHGMA